MEYNEKGNGLSHSPIGGGTGVGLHEAVDLPLTGVQIISQQGRSDFNRLHWPMDQQRYGYGNELRRVS